jgi:PhnB protein
MAVQPIPAGYHSITPHIVVHDAVAAIDFYTRAFGAEVLCRMAAPNGKIMHAEIKIGDSIIMLGEEMRECGNLAPTSLGGTPFAMHLYVQNADEAFERAVLAGATIKMPIQEMFWGDRFGKVTDPFGHQWSLATHVKDVTPAEMEEGMKACMKQPAATC